jgi:hypothetical protein
VIRRISKTNPALQLDIFGEDEWTPLMAVLIRPDSDAAFVADDLRGVFTADELREVAKHLDQVNHKETV